jgi:mxaL protein
MTGRWAGVWQRHGDTLLLSGAALALAVGFLRPVLPWKRALVDQVVVIDITQSMNVPDQRLHGQPVSRLAFAKHRLRQSLSELPCGSKVGWAVFTEYRSFLLFAPVEVCAHLDELRSTLDGIDNRMAWIGASEVAKGLYSGLSIARQLPDRPALVFVTDGHESPPLNPRHRPRFDLKPGEVAGLVVGVGGMVPAAIPKTDPLGRPLGPWTATDVLQVDPRSQGRSGSVDSERLVEQGDDAAAPAAPAAALGATPGSEHLSSLRESYLELLAVEAGLGYQRLVDAAGLVAAMQTPALTRPVPVRADARIALAGLAVLLLLLRQVRQGQLQAAWQRWREARARPA